MSTKLSQFFFKTTKELPRDVELKSHEFLIRGGFCFPYTSGVFGLLPLGHRVLTKIERIVREEMNRIEGQEIRMTCMGTQELWSESGRYQSIGKEMFRLSDRNDRALVLNMTHEEPVVAMARSVLQSHRQLPMMVYQIQTKFRDEARPRGGLIRLREFVMKDAYSFHTSEGDLEAYYDRAHEAYVRVFQRAGLKRVVSVESDNGMFGGAYSHEFQLLVASGEDKLVVCTKCDYRANVEIAAGKIALAQTPPSARAEDVPTPGKKSIDEVASFLNITPQATLKCVAFLDSDRHGVLAFVPGDREVNVKKLQVLHGKALLPAAPAHLREWGLVQGYIGPALPAELIQKQGLALYIDTHVSRTHAWVTGGNREDLHVKGFVLDRDVPAATRALIKTVDLLQIQSGDRCHTCDESLQEQRGIEVGNIFHLGTKYSEKMSGYFLDSDGKRKPYVMGCYGIGITRMLAAIIEEHQDERGPIFPVSVAPFDVHVCVLNQKEPGVTEAMSSVVDALEKSCLEVLVDDRDEKAGSMFADADLIGVPVRVVISPKTLAQGAVELKLRTSADPKAPAALVPIDRLVETVQEWRKRQV